MRLWDAVWLELLPGSTLPLQFAPAICTCYFHNVKSGQTRQRSIHNAENHSTTHKGISYWSQSLSLGLAYGYCYRGSSRATRLPRHVIVSTMANGLLDLVPREAFAFSLEFQKPTNPLLHRPISRIISVSQVSQPCTEHSTVGRMGPFRTHPGYGPMAHSFTTPNKYRLN